MRIGVFDPLFSKIYTNFFQLAIHMIYVYLWTKFSLRVKILPCYNKEKAPFLMCFFLT